MHKIRELGSLPADAFEKYQGMGLKKVRLLLTLINLIYMPESHSV